MALKRSFLFAPDMDSLNCIEQLLEGVDVAYLDGSIMSRWKRSESLPGQDRETYRLQ